MGLTWSIGLTDNVSGPASSAASAVSRLALAMAKLAKATSGGSMASVNDVVSRVSDTLAKSAALKANGNDSAAAKAAASADRAEARAQAQAEKAAGRELAAMAKRQLKAEEQAVKAAERTAAKEAAAAAKAAAKGGGNAGAITRVQGAHPGKASSGGPVSLASAFSTAGAAKLEGALDSLMSKAAATNGSMGELLGTLAEVGPVGAAAAALLAVGTVMVGLVAGGAALALQMSEVREKSVLAFDALSKGGHGGEATLAMIGRLNKELPQSGGQLKTWAKELMAAGTTDMGVLEKRIKAIASAEALMGEDGAAAAAKVASVFEKIAASEQTGKKLKDAGKLLQDTGVTATEVAQKLGVPVEKLNAMMKAGSVDAKRFGDAMAAALIAKGKGPLEAMNMSLETMQTKLVGAFKGMFSGVEVKPFLGELKKVSDAAIKVMGGEGKQAITGIFNALFRMAAAAIPVVAALFKGMAGPLAMAGALIKPLGAAIAKAFGTTPGGGLIAFAEVLGKALAYLVLAMAAVAAILGSVIGGIGAAAVALYGIGEAANQAGNSVAEGLTSALEWVTGLGPRMGVAATEAGNFVAQGLADGISAGVGWVEAAVMGMGAAVKAAVMKVLGIASPSKVMAKLGGYTAEGFAQGVEDHPGPQAAMANAMAPPDAASGGGKGGSRAGGGTFSVEIHVDGSGDPATTARSVRKEIEDLASEWGFSPVPALWRSPGQRRSSTSRRRCLVSWQSCLPSGARRLRRVRPVPRPMVRVRDPTVDGRSVTRD